jgi:hypothetical protein
MQTKETTFVSSVPQQVSTVFVVFHGIEDDCDVFNNPNAETLQQETKKEQLAAAVGKVDSGVRE